MNDSIDQNVYEDLHARVNDGDNGKYGITHPLERLDETRNQIVLAWDQDEPLLIHTDLKTCQQCGSKMRNAGGAEECKAKRCDACGWSVTENGFPALVKLEHGYPHRGKVDGDIDPITGEVVPGYTSQIRLMNQLAHKERAKTPDTTVVVSDNKYRLAADDDGEDVVENMNGSAGLVYGIGSFIALVIFTARVITFNNAGMMPPTWQLVLEFCLACYFSWVYVIVIVLLYALNPEKEEITVDKAFKLRA